MITAFRKDRFFYNKFFSLYFVIVLQNTVTLAIDLTDNMMLGAYSEVSMSGVSVVNQIQFIFQQIIFALCECLVLYAGQYWGQNKLTQIKEFAGIALRIALSFALFLFILVSVFPHQMLSLFTNDENIIAQGMIYLNIVRFNYFFFAVTMLVLAALKSVEVVKIGFYLSVMTFLMNTFINYTLIFGHFGFKSMGVQGAAVGTMIARFFECMFAIIYTFKIDKRLRLKPKDYLGMNKVFLKDYVKTGTPMVAVSALWGVSTAMQSVIMGHLSSHAIAANSVASVLFLLVKGAARGAASTGAIITAKSIGQGDMGAVIDNSKKLQRLFLGLAIAGGVFLFLIRIPVLSIYKLSNQTFELANAFLIVLSIVYIGMAYQMPVSEGIIKGGGDTLFVIKMNLISSFIICLPLAYIMAFVVKSSPIVVICCLHFDQIFKCLPVYLKANHGKWIHKLTR